MLPLHYKYLFQIRLHSALFAKYLLIINALKRANISTFRLHSQLHITCTKDTSYTHGRTANEQREDEKSVGATKIPLPHCTKCQWQSA